MVILRKSLKRAWPHRPTKGVRGLSPSEGTDSEKWPKSKKRQWKGGETLKGPGLTGLSDRVWGCPLETLFSQGGSRKEEFLPFNIGKVRGSG